MMLMRVFIEAISLFPMAVNLVGTVILCVQTLRTSRGTPHNSVVMHQRVMLLTKAIGLPTCWHSDITWTVSIQLSQMSLFLEKDRHIH